MPFLITGDLFLRYNSRQFMKKAVFTLFATILTVAMLHAFRIMQNSSISGKIVPGDAVEVVWVFSGRDSVRTIPIDGAFVITVKPGPWTLVVDAKEPYKDAVLEKVDVKEGQNTDVGEIKLQQ